MSCFMGKWVSSCPLLSVWLSQRVPHPWHTWIQYLPERGRFFMAQVLQQITREHSPSLIHSSFWSEEKLKSNFTLNLIELSQRQNDAQFGKGNSHQLRYGREREESISFPYIFSTFNEYLNIYWWKDQNWSALPLIPVFAIKQWHCACLMSVLAVIYTFGTVKQLQNRLNCDLSCLSHTLIPAGIWFKSLLRV